VIFLMMLFTACSTSTLESQSKAQSSSQARIYFLRETNPFGILNTPNIKINGQKVGELAAGSFFFIDRDPGTYALTVETIAPGRFSAQITLRPRAVYYVEVAPRPAGVALTMAAGLAGQLLDAAVSENSGYYSITPLDEQTGRAKLAKLKG